MKPYPLILASTSKYRKALLEQLGIPFECHASQVNEDQFKSNVFDSEKLALELAKLKAHDVYKRFPDSCVIGSDQVCSLENQILSKPGNFDKAKEQLLRMQGKTHQLSTAVCLVSPQGETTFINRTFLTMRKLSEEEITRYLQADTPYDCAGSYKLESHGIRLFEKIDMTDHTSIIGLPLIELTTHLLEIGYSI